MRGRILLLAVVLAMLVLPFQLGTSALTTATFVVIAAIGATGLNVLTGYAGQISLGHAFFLAVGAYTGAKLGEDLGWSAALWIPAAGVVAGACGALVGPVALRLSGLYLAIVTLGLVFIGQHVFFNAESLTGGPQGRTFPVVVIGPFDFAAGQVLQIGSLQIDNNGLYYYLALALLAGATAFAWNVRRTRSGRAMVAVRERELAASVMGVDVRRVKIAAFTASAVMAGVSGALYASYLSFAQPGEWSLLLSIQFVAAVIVGGMGSVAGPLLGSAVVFALPTVLKNLPFLPEEAAGGISVSDLSSIAYGLLIVAFLVLQPRGLVGLVNQPKEAHS
ncbi:MAG TPA: branched-chain amino acid ABC transporter permease [Solirubrobacteraceae bacterium]|jgi:branched-chain amino acid transport system permease protein|nr:branched-chain amino acid ABC transporter permease [Solirubrobacteraceae bacterium]